MSIKEKFKALPKESRNNIVVMIILMFLFIVGIATRWDYIKTEVGDSVNRYVEVFDQKNIDSLKNQNK